MEHSGGVPIWGHVQLYIARAFLAHEQCGDVRLDESDIADILGDSSFARSEHWHDLKSFVFTYKQPALPGMPAKLE